MRFFYIYYRCYRYKAINMFGARQTREDARDGKRMTLSMRRILYWLFCYPVLTQAQLSDFNLKNPGDYNNYIMLEMTSTVQKNFEYISFCVHSDEYDQLEVKRKEVVAEILKAADNIRQMPSLEGDTRLRDEAVIVLNEYKNAFELDYQKIIGLKRKSKDSYESMQEYFDAQDKAEEKVNNATRKLRVAQHAYASSHGMDVVDNKSDDELEQKMNKVIAVNNYWRALFLNYFKIVRQYDKMWDVLPNQKANAIDKERLLVIKVIGQVLPLLKAAPDFNGDKEFRDQTVNIVEYYQVVAETHFKRIVEILNKKSLEQKDVDEVNGIIHQCNLDHEQLTYNWNIASQELLRKNVDPD